MTPPDGDAVLPARPRPGLLPSRRLTIVVLLLNLALLVPAVAIAATGDPDPSKPSRTPPRVAATQQIAGAAGELVAAAGDIACAPDNLYYRGGEGAPVACRERQVADLLDKQRLGAFLGLGDQQYEVGSLEEFTRVYDQFFGPYKSITRPVPGNHDYYTPNGRGYYDYFGAAAHEVNPYGAAAAGSYSFNVGAWHLIAINANMCSSGQPCDDRHALMRWLKDDLARNPNRCTLAYWHHPLWSAGAHGSYAPMTPVWNTLLDAGVDLVLNGHDHNYQRFAPIGRAQAADAIAMLPPVVVPEDEGMRLFIVGTGGANNYDVDNVVNRPDLAGALEASYANSAVSLNGVLFLRLGATGYQWSFAEAEPKPAQFHDAGTGTCH